MHGAHGYLIGQFLSSATNRREDDYGGSLENRTRLAQGVLAAIRSEVRPDFPIGIRIGADEEVAGGITPAEAIEIAHLLEPSIDYLDVTLGSYYHLHKILAPMDGGPIGYELPKASEVTAPSRSRPWCRDES
ncbi:hypothetical protein EEB14_36695 [Rhodococcus sp. WS4]|nr:hypothetical protein EEB14_36695 [Rhodococcus sp. WS4]